MPGGLGHEIRVKSTFKRNFVANQVSIFNYSVKEDRKSFSFQRTSRGSNIVVSRTTI